VLSVAVDIIEQMFEYSVMSPALTVPGPAATRADVRALQQRIRDLEVTRVDNAVFAVTPALEGLFPEAGLRRGSTYEIDASSSLLWSLLAGPTSQGVWCAVVGMPDVGVAAAEDMGVNLDRLILVPSPDSQWLSVVSALIDVVGIVALGTHAIPSDRMLSTLTGRLREREATLLVRSGWPRTEAQIGVETHAWRGLGAGHGVLHEHCVRITLNARHGHATRRCDLVIDHTGARADIAHAAVTDIATRRNAG
jgi:hypothetical protein